MANKKIDITLEIDEELLNKSLGVFETNGLTIEKAVENFISNVANNNSVLFDTKNNKDTYLDAIANVLAGHYDYIYYVNVDDSSYLEFNTKNTFRALEVGETGKDFFSDAIANIDIVIHKDDREKIREFLDKDSLLSALKERDNASIVYRMITTPKPEYFVMVASLSKTDSNKLIIDVRNIDDSIKKQQKQARDLERASSLAHLDSLTQCLNYLAFQEEKDAISLKIKEGINDFAVLMCDLNDLKNINDDSGHLIGDEFLVRTANILRDIFPNSKIYRIGGDEFFVVLIGEDFANREQLVNMLKSISNDNKNIDAPVIAVGMAELKEDTRDFSSLFVEADQKMYEHKKQLKGEK